MNIESIKVQLKENNFNIERLIKENIKLNFRLKYKDLLDKEVCLFTNNLYIRGKVNNVGINGLYIGETENLYISYEDIVNVKTDLFIIDSDKITINILNKRVDCIVYSINAMLCNDEISDEIHNKLMDKIKNFLTF